MSGLFGSTVIKGNRITDFAQTTATVGVQISFGYGRFVVDGNIIFAKLPPKESVKRKKQGKGGVKTETYTYTTSYAVAFAQRIYGFWWIKRNGKVVYTQDPNAPVEDREFAQKWLQRATLYLGTEQQLPDSTIEATVGAGKVSAFRGLSYIVLEDDDVTDGGGAIPSYTACVIASPPITYVTSRPYPALDVFNLNTEGELRSGGFGEPTYLADHADTNASIEGGDLRDLLIRFSIEPDEIETDAQAEGGQLVDLLKIYQMVPEALNTSAAYRGGVLENKLVRYDKYPPESVDTIASFNGGVLE